MSYYVRQTKRLTTFDDRGRLSELFFGHSNLFARPFPLSSSCSARCPHSIGEQLEWKKKTPFRRAVDLGLACCFPTRWHAFTYCPQTFENCQAPENSWECLTARVFQAYGSGERRDCRKIEWHLKCKCWKTKMTHRSPCFSTNQKHVQWKQIIVDYCVIDNFKFIRVISRKRAEIPNYPSEMSAMRQCTLIWTRTWGHSSSFCSNPFKNCYQKSFESIAQISAHQPMNFECMNENARMSFFDDDEEEMDMSNMSENVHDENMDSGLGSSISRGKLSTLTSMFGFLSSPSACERNGFNAILVSQKWNEK